MKAVILAAGMGKRLKPLSDLVPKALLKIHGKPVLEYIVNDLIQNNFDEICIVIGHHGDKIQEHFGNGQKFGAKISYVVQPQLLGTANALYRARNFVGNEPFLLHLGDAINPNALKTHIQNLLNDDSDISILTVVTPTVLKKNVGNVETSEDKVVKIAEKITTNSNLSWAGVAVFKNWSIFEKIKSLPPSHTGEYEITDAMNEMLSDKITIKHFVCERSIDAGTQKGLEEASKHLS